MGPELKLSYFAWVRERVGKSDETLTPPTEVRTVADLIAWLSARGEVGEAVFTQPEPMTIVLPRGTMFPTEHTLLLIRSAESGERFLTRQVFDGGEVEGPSEVTAAIGQPSPAAAGAKPVLARRGWPLRLAFYKPDAPGSEPDYEVGMRLLDNGVAEAMTLDYGDMVVRAKLREIEELKPTC